MIDSGIAPPCRSTSSTMDANSPPSFTGKSACRTGAARTIAPARVARTMAGQSGASPSRTPVAGEEAIRLAGTGGP